MSALLVSYLQGCAAMATCPHPLLFFSKKNKMEMTAAVISMDKVYPAMCYVVFLNRKPESSVPIISRCKPQMDKNLSGMTEL